MRHGSLFSGIGGFELAAEWMGWDNIFHCEMNTFGAKVLHHYWPQSEHYGDIKSADFTKYAGTIDILTGGFPCQPYSVAGKRKGKDDERHLWPDMLRVIQQVKPRWIIGENVFGLLSWNGGLVFDEVCSDLEANGYAVWPVVLPAAAVNAPHRRDRVWFIAKNSECDGCVCGKSKKEESKIRRQRDACTRSTNGIYLQERFIAYSDNGRARREETQCQWRECKQQGSEVWSEFAATCQGEPLTNSKNSRLTPRIERQGQEQFRRRDEPMGARQWQGFPTQSPVCSGDDGIPARLDGITFPKWRNESIKAYGNAIVPQVAYEIFRTIEVFEQQLGAPQA